MQHSPVTEPNDVKRDATKRDVDVKRDAIKCDVDGKRDVKRDMKKSAIRAYASELLLLVVRSSGDVKYLKKFSKILLSIGAQDEASR